MLEQGSEKGSVLFSWKALSFVSHQRGWTWNIVGIVAAALMIFYALYYEQSWIMAVTVAVLAAATFLSLYEKPQELETTIWENGVTFRDEFYSYEQVKSFWFVTHPGHCSLNLDLVGRFSGSVSIHLKDEDLGNVRSILAQYLPEDTKRKESFFESLARQLKL